MVNLCNTTPNCPGCDRPGCTPEGAKVKDIAPEFANMTIKEFGETLQIPEFRQIFSEELQKEINREVVRSIVNSIKKKE